MSEHKHNHTRYWMRLSEADGAPVFFVTESNAAHARAESDGAAREIAQEDYEAAVPVEARGAAFDAAAGQPAPKPVETPVAKPNGHTATAEQVINAYRQEMVQHMMQTHTQIVQTLMQAPIAHAERVFILEAIKMELMQSMMAQRTAAPVVRAN